jgi:hypothetical protein
VVSFVVGNVGKRERGKSAAETDPKIRSLTSTAL